MRCPNCNKFVSLENGQPEINSLEVEYSEETFTVTADIHHDRNCADCSDVMKSIDHNEEDSVDLDKLDGFDKLTEDERKRLREGLANGSLEATVEESDCEVEESGGGRYAKNIIAVVLSYTLSVPLDDERTLTYSGVLRAESPASGYEEQC